MVIDLREPSRYDIKSDGDTVTVSFAAAAASGASGPAPTAQTITTISTKSEEPVREQTVESSAARPDRRGRYRGAFISGYCPGGNLYEKKCGKSI